MTTTSTSPTPRRRFRRVRIIVLGLAFMILAGVGFVYYREWADEAELRAVIAEIEKTDPDWRMLQGTKQVKIPDEENPTVIVEAVRKLLPPRWQNTTINAAIRKINPKYRLPDKIVEAIRAELQPLEQAVAGARKLAKVLDKDRGVAPIHLHEEAPEAFQLLLISELLIHDATLRAYEGDMETALARCPAIVLAGTARSEYPSLLTFLVHESCRRLCVDFLERALAQGQPSVLCVEKVQRLLEGEVTKLQIADALRTDRALSNLLIAQLRAGKIDQKLVQTAFFRKKGILGTFTGYFDKPSLTQFETQVLKYYGEAIEVAKAPMHHRPQLWTALWGRWESAHDAVKSAVLGIGGHLHESLLGQAELRCAIAALAAERFRLQTNRWPKNQDDLLECKLLVNLQLDPYTGTPLRFRHTVDGLVIYSVGRNGNYAGDAWDNDTIPRGVERSEFRLWNVDQRRQPPPKQP